MIFVVRSNDSFNFPLGWIKYIVIVVPVPAAWRRWYTSHFGRMAEDRTSCGRTRLLHDTPKLTGYFRLDAIPRLRGHFNGQWSHGPDKVGLWSPLWIFFLCQNSVFSNYFLLFSQQFLPSPLPSVSVFCWYVICFVLDCCCWWWCWCVCVCVCVCARGCC